MIVLALTVVSFPSFNRPLKLYLVRALTASQKESFANEKSQEMLIERKKVGIFLHIFVNCLFS